MSKESKTYKNSAKKVYIRTFGCQANFRDSEWIAGQFISRGWDLSETEKDADLIIINTCSVRYHAEHRAISFLGSLKKIKDASRMKIAITGCTAEAYGDKLLKKYPYLDGIFGPSQENELIENIERLLNGDKIAAVGKQSGLKKFNVRGDFREKNLTAYVSIMEGCNNFCTYCIVPYTRGRERSRPIKEIVDEVKFLKDKGYKEIMLLGQNVNSYGVEIKNKFIKLLEEVDKTGVERVRFMTSHPKDADEELFKAMRDLPHVCEYLHLPLQSGSDKILKLMNRNYTLGDYLKLVEAYRKYNPGGSITTDIIVGFPNETDSDFEKTIYAMKEIRFDSAFIFKYSPRPHVKAVKFEDNVTVTDKKKRNNLALKLQKEISFQNKKSRIGTSMEVLFDRVQNGKLYGKSRESFLVEADGNNLVGSIKNVKITAVTLSGLIGKVI